VRWFSRRERPLFRTHEPPFRRPEWAIGQLVEYEDRVWRVTRWAELRPVLLERGGSVGEWEIWGRAVSDQELRDEVNRAADRLLDSEPGSGQE
jgi:hypothetical protein